MRGAGLLCSALLVGSSCSSTAQRTVTTPAATTSVAAAPTSTVATTVVPGVDTTVAQVVATTAPVDAPAVLAQAVAALANGYHFTTRVFVNGEETLVADGDRIAASSRLTLFSKGGSVAYVITPEGSWALPENGEWSALDTPPATADPIIALQTPTAVTLVSSDGVTTALTVTVGAAALGVAAEGVADVQVTVSGGQLQQVRYSAALTDGTVAEVSAAISPLVDTSPIVAPL
jgi:hypothetical protein